MFRFEGTVVKYDGHGKALYKYPTSLLANTADEAREKARGVWSAKYDDFRQSWSHIFNIDSAVEVSND